MSLIRMVWKRKISVLVLWAIVTAGTAAFVQSLPAVYSTSALIILDSQKIPERYVSATVNTDVQDRFATISQQILSSSQLKKMIDQFNLYPEERKTKFPEEVLEMMRTDITITPERNVTGSRPEAFRITYRGRNPVVVAQVVNQIANLYIEENLRSREEQAGGTSEFIDAQLAGAKQKLDELEGAVSSYKVQHNGELPQQESSLNGILGRLQMELEANRDGLNRAQSTKVTNENSLAAAEESLQSKTRALQQLVAAGKSAPPAAAIDGLQPEKSDAEILRAELKTLRGRYSDEHPDVIQLAKRLERAEGAERSAGRKQPARTAGGPAPQPSPPQEAKPVYDTPDIRQARERISTLQAQLATVLRELETRREDQKRILSDMAAYQARISRLPIREQEMSQITRDYEIAKLHYRSLLDKKISADMAADMERRQQAERFTIADPARVPGKPSSPNRTMLRGAGCVAGLALGLMFGLAREIRLRTVLGEWQVPAGIPVIARVPEIKHSSLEPAIRQKRAWWFRKPEAVS
jgi:polysaccharide chain length determinant protein (PEP-CTERM system associated)